MTLVEPTFTLTMQMRMGTRLSERSGFDLFKHDAVIMTHPDIIMTGGVEFSLSSQIGIGTARFDINNVSPEIMAAIKPGGSFYVTGGYNDIIGSGSDIGKGHAMFAGNILTVTPYQDGENTVWAVEGTTTPLHALNVCIPLDSAGSINIKDAIEYLLTKAAVNPSPLLRASKASRGLDTRVPDGPGYAIVPEEWTMANVAMDEISKLIEYITWTTGMPHVLIPTIDEAFRYELANLYEAENDRPFFHFDTKASTIYSHGPTTQFVEPELNCAEDEDGESTEYTLRVINERLQAYFDYTLVVPFDPRIRPGSQINLANGLFGNGAFLAMEVKHDFNGDTATTTVSGPFFGESLI